MNECNLLVPVEMLEKLPALLFNAMIFIKECEQQKGRSDAAQIHKLLTDLETARNNIGKVLGFRVSQQ